MLFTRLSRHLRLRHLQLLVVLQTCGSIGRAASHLDMSQSAATQALNELERILGIRLFERHARGIRPTLAGQAMIDTARGVMNALEAVSDSLSEIQAGVSLSLRLGAIPAAASSILAPLLSQFHEERPQVHVAVQERDGPTLLSDLLAGNLDAIFCRQPTLLPDNIVFEPLLEDDAVFVASANHPLINKRKTPLASLSEARWVLPTFNIEVRDVFERVVLPLLPQANWFPVSTKSLPVLGELLSQPGAVGLSPRSMVANLKNACPHAHIDILDVVIDHQSMVLRPLGVAYWADTRPEWLLTLLSSWPVPSNLPSSCSP